MPPLTLIVASTTKLGIGHRGTLPWNLKHELRYFARVTSRVPASLTRPGVRVQNAIVMGRRTWESIPERLRPLKGRVNVVLSSGPRREVEKSGAVWCTGLEEAIAVLRDMEVGAGQDTEAQSCGDGNGNGDGNGDGGEEGPVRIGRVFVIGGRAVYKAALERPETKRVLLTKVYGDWDCDVFFPVDIEHENGWERKKLNDFRDWVGEEVPEGRVKEGDVEFEYFMFERD